MIGEGESRPGEVELVELVVVETFQKSFGLVGAVAAHEFVEDLLRDDVVGVQFV